MPKKQKLSAELIGVIHHLETVNLEKIDRSALMLEFGFGKDKVAKITKTLKDHGFLELKKTKGKDGKFTGWEWKLKKSQKKRIKGKTKRERATILVKILAEIRNDVKSDKHFRSVIDIAIKEIENTQNKPKKNFELIISAVEFNHAHTYEEISEDIPLPLDTVRRFVATLVKKDKLTIIQSAVPKTNNKSHLIISSENPCELCFPGKVIEFSELLRKQNV